MSTYTYTIPGTSNKFPCFPGLYLLSGLTDGNTHIPYPIFKSMSDFDNIASLDNTADVLLIMPGYRVILYSGANYSGQIIDTSNNSTSLTVVDIANNNVATSVKLYYGSTANGWTEIT